MATQSRRTFMSYLSLIPLSGLMLWSSRAEATHYAAQLCNGCGFGSKKDNCVRCGKWTGSTKIAARLCGQCGFGNKQNNCAKCGKWVGSHHQLAYLCNNCGFGNKKNNCVKCGKWAP